MSCIRSGVTIGSLYFSPKKLGLFTASSFNINIQPPALALLPYLLAHPAIVTNLNVNPWELIRMSILVITRKFIHS